MKKVLLPMLLMAFSFNDYGQKMQATIKPGSDPRTIDVYLMASSSFSQKDEAMTFVLAIPADVLPAPSLGSSGVTTNVTGPIATISGLQPNFIIDNLGSTQREVVVSKEIISGNAYFIYTFIFSGTANVAHSWTANVEQRLFSIQFNGCTSNCNSGPQMLVNLPNGGSNGISYWYFQSNTLGDITDYSTPFYSNSFTGLANNGESSDGSALSSISLLTIVTLPVILNSFNAYLENCTVVTKWSIAEDRELAFYGIERSSGENFYEIGRVNAGNNITSTNYSFVDNNTKKGEAFYRIRLVDKDGKYTFSSSKKINVNCRNKGSVFVYPTLSKGLINVRLSVGFETALVRIINLLGQEVAFDASKNLFRALNLNGLANGTYIVQVINKGELPDNVKIVLVH